MLRRLVLLSIVLLSTAGYQAQSLEERLRPLVNQGLAQRSNSSVMIAEVESGRVVASENPARKVIPASNLKLVTTAAALDLLGEDFEFRTTLSIRGSVEAGVLSGDVLLRGSGDPTMGLRFYEGGATEVLSELGIALRREGIERIEGDVIIESGYFDERWVHPTWPADQLVYWYEAPVSAPAIQEGTVIVRVSPGPPGQPGIVELEPPNALLAIENHSVTQRRGRGVFVGRKPGTNMVLVRGNVRPGSGPTTIPVTVMNPLAYVSHVFYQALLDTGVQPAHRPVVTARDPHDDWKEVDAIDTPLAVAIYVVNKQSQNHFAEQILKTIGAEVKRNGSWEAATEVVQKWMRDQVGTDPAGFSIVDGSGMSRANRMSAEAFVDLLRYMWRNDSRMVFITSMPYSGERSSRLRRRLNREPYARNVYAKTGYISKVVSLSGYVRGRSGTMYAFSILFNDFPTWTGPMYQLQNAILQTVIDHG